MNTTTSTTINNSLKIKDQVIVKYDNLREVIVKYFNLEGNGVPTSLEGKALNTCDVFGEVVAAPGTGNVQVKITRVLNEGKDVFFYPPIRGLIIEISNDLTSKLAEDAQTKAKKAEDADKAKEDFYRTQISEKLVLQLEARSFLDYFYVVDPSAHPADKDKKPSKFVGEGEKKDKPVIIILLVTKIDRRLTEDLIEVKLRSIVDPVSKTAKKLKPKTVVNKLGFQEDMSFVVRLEHVRKATPQDELDSCTRNGGPTKLDELAIRYPGYFIARFCDYDWKKAKEFYKQTDPGNLLFDYGGMNALLEYRSWLANMVLERISDLAYHQAKNEKITQALASTTLARTTQDAETVLTAMTLVSDFISETKKIGWDAPGSAEATSDIDLNTWGDGTEWAATTFNYLFRSMHKDTESGIVYDINFYAKDYLPQFEDKFKARGTSEAEFFAPKYDHTFSETNSETKADDRVSQSVTSYLHMRRYMTTPEWNAYRDLIEKDEFKKFYDESNDAGIRFFANLSDLIAAMNQLLKQKKVKNTGINPGNQSFSTADQIQAQISKISDVSGNQVQMSAENRLYEGRLRLVTSNRLKFTLKKFQSKRSSAGNPAPTVTEIDVDKSYQALRAAIADALYFANECYATEGSIVQVVAGKQKLSAGVTLDRQSKTVKMHNIAYTPHQLMHTMNEQIGDFFKEATRDYAHDTDVEHKTPEEAFGNAILASGKYLHRYFNAMKYLYAAGSLGQAYADGNTEDSIASILEFPDDEELVIKGGRDLFEALEAVGEREKGASDIPSVWFQKDNQGRDHIANFRTACGFGLEMLKKFKEGRAKEKYPYQTKDNYEWYVDFLAAQLSFTRGDLLTNGNGELIPKWQIASKVVTTYFAYLDLSQCKDPHGAVIQQVDSLDKLKSALLFLHAKVTKDYYAGLDNETIK